MVCMDSKIRTLANAASSAALIVAASAYLAGWGEEALLAMPVSSAALALLGFRHRRALMAAMIAAPLLASGLLLAGGGQGYGRLGVLSFASLASAAIASALEYALGGKDG